MSSSLLPKHIILALIEKKISIQNLKVNLPSSWVPFHFCDAAMLLRNMRTPAGSQETHPPPTNMLLDSTVQHNCPFFSCALLSIFNGHKLTSCPAQAPQRNRHLRSRPLTSTNTVRKEGEHTWIFNKPHVVCFCPVTSRSCSNLVSKWKKKKYGIRTYVTTMQRIVRRHSEHW